MLLPLFVSRGALKAIKANNTVARNALLSWSRGVTGRGHYVKGGSNPTSFSDEVKFHCKEVTTVSKFTICQVKDLLRHARHSGNAHEWQREEGIQDPIRLDLRDPDDIDDDQVIRVSLT